MEAWSKTAQRIRVPLGTVLGVILLILMRPTTRSLWLGGSIALIGAALRVWAAGHIDKGRTLTRGGPYALTRNPLYFGSFIMALGILMAGQVYWLLLPFGVFFLSVYYPVMKAEEKELREGHGSEFQDYAREVPLFVPRLGRMSNPTSIFRWARVLQNREHRTLLGLLLTGGFLLIRSIY